MAYIFDPSTMSYIYYKDGTKPPKITPSSDEVLPGFTQAYQDTFPNQPFSMQQIGGDNGGGTGAPNPDGSGMTADGMRTEIISGGSGSSAASGGDATAQRNAAEYLQRLFDSYGLGTLAPKILEYVQAGYDSDTIMLMLQDTAEYKQRFAANEARRKNGLAVLSPAEYLATERSYRQIMESAGLPPGYYDSQDDYTNLIGGDVSPAELQSRVDIGVNAVNNSDPYYLTKLREFGLGQGDLIAAALDRDRALPLLQKTVKAAQIGAEASRNNLGLSQARSNYFADLGVSQEQARSAYQLIGENLGTAQKLGSIYDTNFGQEDLENELLGQSGLASAKRKRLVKKETGAFTGSSGVGRTSLAGKNRSEY